jgi:hypothetical protein
MPVVVRCGCGKQFRVSDEIVGKRVKCPSCGEAQLIQAGAVSGPVAKSSTSARPPVPTPEPAASLPPPPPVPQEKKPKEPGSGVLTKVIVAVFGTVIAPIAVALGIKYLSPQEKAADAPPTREAPATKKEEGPRTLFALNGKDLSGFYSYSAANGRGTDPKKVFTVQDGMLRISGEEGNCYLATQKDTYNQYRLIVEYKWGEKTWPPLEEKARYSYILFHAQGADGHLYGYRCGVGEGRTGDLSIQQGGPEPLWLDYYLNPAPDGKDTKYGDYHIPVNKVFLPGGTKTGWFGQGPICQINHDRDFKDVKGFRSKNEIEKPTGQWNILEIVCGAKSIEVELNGSRVNAASQTPNKPGATGGKIAFYSRGAEIFCRRFEVISLKSN